MALGLPAKYEITVKSELAREDFSIKSLDAIESIGWKVKVATNDYIQAKSGINIYTLGETIEISFTNLNHIKLESSCNFQFFDFNKNKANLRLFWSYFSN